ncbi:hypothetical protein C900_04203 [Fulvivirga imtechensis AK7]|uniref:SPOR domain-containing protein n=1 Tax=Fulvivirga imtechensis AK7 TaxID=1237149 RepID=L8JWD9_9BACT|nr:PorP/SprF family type IX secretion system membrane protein [Fulvivirga imtechensis]ELR73351.1 hypothetical protein C900_04203 [Fulvivirga imtechensis AK7]
MKRTLALLLITFVCTLASGQQMPVYNQFFFNPALYNPSFIGQSGYTEANVNHRQQWVGVEGAPVTTNINFQVPLSRKLALGAVLYSDTRGLLSTYETSAGLSYGVELSRMSRLSFGLTVGVGRNDIDFVITDRALTNTLDKSYYMAGQFGMSLNIEKLTLGFSLPRLVESKFLQEYHFEELGIEATKITFSSLGYKFDLGPRVQLEPVVFYQTDEKSKNQLGGLAVLTYDNLIWIGGSYKQDVGANAFLGLNVNNFLKVGYSYEFAPEVVTGFGNGTHEFQLGIRLGKKNKRESIIPSPTSKPKKPQVEENAIAEPEEEDEEEETVTEVEDKEVEEPEQTFIEEEYEEEGPDEVIPITEPADEPIIKTEKTDPVAGMKPGYYVVVGAYRSKQNAESYIKNLRSYGYEALSGYSPQRELNYVYIRFSEDRTTAIEARNQIRKISRFEFKDAWILQVER